MLFASMPPRLRQAAHGFLHADGGNIAIIFAFALIPVVSLMGAAIDYTRANAARSSMQAALDSTTLMMSRDLSQGVIQPSDVNADKAGKYFTALYTNKDARGVSITATYTAASGSTPATILATGSGYINSDFMQIAGFPTLSFDASSTSTWGNAKMRVALALDNTGSMAQNGKIGALKTAVAGSGGLIDQLSNLSKNQGDVFISIVPFAKVVNVGAGNYNASWIDWTDWLNPPFQQPNNGSYQAKIPNSSFTTIAWTAYWAAMGPGTPCPFRSSNGFPYFRCASNSTNGSSHVTTIPASGNICPSEDTASHTFYNGCWDSIATGLIAPFCTGSSCSCNNFPGSSSCSCTGSGSTTTCSAQTYTHTWHPNATSTWTGCITDRTQPNDATGVLPTGADATTQFPANQQGDGYCSISSPQLEQIIPLSYNWTTLKTATNAMQPTGTTNQAIGLAWAWQSLIPGGVLNAPQEDSTSTYNRVIILLSDGLNTEDRWPDYGNGSNQTTTNGNSQFPGSIDARQQALCDNLKNAKDSKGNALYTVYTIQVNTDSPPDATSQILKYCASSPDKFYELTSSSQIVTTFNTIGTALSKLRVAQ